MANDLKTFLNGIPDADVTPANVDDELLDRWAGSESKLQVRANVHRFLLGRALKYRRLQLRQGERGPWLEEVGERWGRSVTTLRALMRIANVIEVALGVSEENGKHLPIRLLDRPWVEVTDAIRAHMGDEQVKRASQRGVPAIPQCLGIIEARVTASLNSLDDVRKLKAGLAAQLNRLDEAEVALTAEAGEHEVDLGVIDGGLAEEAEGRAPSSRGPSSEPPRPESPRPEGRGPRRERHRRDPRGSRRNPGSTD